MILQDVAVTVFCGDVAVDPSFLKFIKRKRIV